MFSKRDKHYLSRSGQTSLATAVTNITKPVTKIDFGPSTMPTIVTTDPKGSSIENVDLADDYVVPLGRVRGGQPMRPRALRPHAR